MDTTNIKIIFKKTDSGKNAYLGKIRVGSYWYSKLTKDAKSYRAVFQLNLPTQNQTQDFDKTEECENWILEKTKEFLTLLEI